MDTKKERKSGSGRFLEANRKAAAGKSGRFQEESKTRSATVKGGSGHFLGQKKPAGWKKAFPWIVAAVLAAAAAAAGWLIYVDQQPKFHDLTVELGTETVGIRDFMTKYASAKRVSFVSDPSSIDLAAPGSTSVTLRHGRKEETVLFTVQDTVAPTGTIPETYTVTTDRGIPPAEELVPDIQDAGQVTVTYLEEPEIPYDYSDLTVTLVMEDSSGNKTQGETRLVFAWMRESLTMELGEKLTPEMLLYNPERDSDLVDEDMLKEVNRGGLGTYSVSRSIATKEYTCQVTVQDTKGPDLVLKDVQRRPNGKVPTLKDFIASAEDPSGIEEIRLLTELSTGEAGVFPVVIEAEDKLGNIVQGEAALRVSDDAKAPVLEGGKEPLTVAKHSSPDFLEGISATDDRDGVIPVTCDTGKLDLDTAGTYYITYTAADKAGNVTTLRRKVVVEHDQEDTEALLRTVADELSDNPLTIRNYVRQNVEYNSDWGGDDPVWYGLATHSGNCYVHALCLKALLDVKGHETQLIWTTDKSHYWVLIKRGEDLWRHIDATPGTNHANFNYMNDEQRLKTLTGRTWDTAQWPACE